MNPTAWGLVAFAGWFVLLSVALGFYRMKAMRQGKAANTFAPDGRDLDALGQRLTRARDNCFETLPIFAALALGAQIAGRLDVTDGLAPWVAYLRIGQSITHVASTSVPAVMLRAGFFFAQMLIYLLWTFRLL